MSRPEPPAQDARDGALSGAGRPPLDSSVFDELLTLEPPDGVGPVWHAFSPLVSWLITATGPNLTVELGPGDRASLLSTADAVQRLGGDARCLAVRLPGPGTPDARDFLALVDECAARYPGRIAGRSEGALSPGEVVDGAPVELLHLALFDLVDSALPDLSPWFEVCAPGTTVVITGSSPTSGAFAQATRVVSDLLPSVRVPTGGTTAALVAQLPVEGTAPTVELLRSAPPAVGRQLALLGGPSEEGDQPTPPPETRELVRTLQQRQDVERAALLSAVQAYRDYATGLSSELAVVRQDLMTQREGARLERDRLVEEFLGRLDVLTAKISTSASRYAAELEDKDRALDELEQRMLAYAGQAATAQSIVDDIRRSTSWRITAPVRLLSRLMAGRPSRRVE